jgi:hypothetical protein
LTDQAFKPGIGELGSGQQTVLADGGEDEKPSLEPG